MASESDVCAHSTLQIHLVPHFTFPWQDVSMTANHAMASYRSPRSVLSRVSFASQTLNQPPFASLSNSVTVRHAPFTAMESPMWQSSRMGAESAMMSVHPPASWTISTTVPRCSIYAGKQIGDDERRATSVRVGIPDL